MYASSSSPSSPTSLPASQYFPELGESRQPIKFISVDLPDPDGPMMATYSPCRTSTSTPRSACTCSAPISYPLASASVLITRPELTGLPGKNLRLVSRQAFESPRPWLRVSSVDLPASSVRCCPPSPEPPASGCAALCSCPRRSHRLLSIPW